MVTACVSGAQLGTVVAGAFWVLFFGGLAVLARRTHVERRNRNRHAVALAALRRHHPSQVPDTPTRYHVAGYTNPPRSPHDRDRRTRPRR